MGSRTSFLTPLLVIFGGLAGATVGFEQGEWLGLLIGGVSGASLGRLASHIVGVAWQVAIWVALLGILLVVFWGGLNRFTDGSIGDLAWGWPGELLPVQGDALAGSDSKVSSAEKTLSPFVRDERCLAGLTTDRSGNVAYLFSADALAESNDEDLWSALLAFDASVTNASTPIEYAPEKTCRAHYIAVPRAFILAAKKNPQMETRLLLVLKSAIGANPHKTENTIDVLHGTTSGAEVVTIDWVPKDLGEDGAQIFATHRQEVSALQKFNLLTKAK